MLRLLVCPSALLYLPTHQKVGEEMPGFAPTFGGGMPQGAVQWRCLRKVGEEMPGFTPTFGGGMPQGAVQGRCRWKVGEEMPGITPTFGG